jgi:aryl-alcohol dehydrogenase-like predicted oxidoreductase
MQQLEDNMGSAGWTLSEEQMAKLNVASEPELVYPYEHIIRAQSRR